MKLKVLFLLLTFLSLNMLSQEIIISFEGKDEATSNKLTIDKVEIDNLTTGKTIVVNSSTELNLTTVLSVGTIDVFDTFKGIKNVFPNPMTSAATIDFYSEGNSKSTLVVYNIQGKEITKLERKFALGNNRVEFKSGSKGIYFIKLIDAGKSYYSKIISTNHQFSRASLIYLETKSKQQKTETKKSANTFFSSGDVLRLTATAGTLKNTIYTSPKASKTFTFNFNETFYQFEKYLVLSEYPSFVNIMFSVTDQNNKGVDYLENEDFEVLENGSKISPSESFRYVKKLNQVPSVQRTVLMLDKSFSIRNSLPTIKKAALSLIQKIADNQEIAIYEFSETPILLTDFTSDKAVLEAAINSIEVDFPTTNLYGSVIIGLNKINNTYTLEGIEEGYLVVLTDGDDTQASSTLQQVISARGNKKVFMIGLGSDLNEENLNDIAYPSNYINAVNADELEEKFEEIHLDMLRFSNSFYWLNYMSPKRSNSHSLTVKAKENYNTNSNNKITSTFSANGFVSVLYGVYANVQPGEKYGIDTLKVNYKGLGDLEIDYQHQLDNNNAITNGLDTIGLKSVTFWAEKVPKYTYTLEHDSIVDIIIDENDDRKIKLKPKSAINSETKITIRDIANDYEKVVVLKIINTSKFYLASNGITIKAIDGLSVGDNEEINGVKYTYVDKDLLRTMLNNGEDLSKVVTSGLTNLNTLFISTGLKTFNQNISSWDVSNVTSMVQLFASQSDFNQDISYWDVSNVKNMNGMFSWASSFNQDISSWDVSNVDTMDNLFQKASAFNQDIGSWNVRNVTSMGAMFNDAIRFNQNISNWDTRNVKNMNSMFNGASSYNRDLSTWNVSNVTSMGYMFAEASSFNQDIGSWDVSKVKNMSAMFLSASDFNQDISSWEICQVEDSRWFGSNTSDWLLKNKPGLPDFAFGFAENGVTIIIRSKCEIPIGNQARINGKLYTLVDRELLIKKINSGADVSKVVTSGITDMDSLFLNKPSFNQDISSWDMSNVTNTSSMFRLASTFNQDISYWDVSEVTNMSFMFNDAIAFNQNIGIWDVSNVTTMESLFNGAKIFNQNIASWNVSEVKNMGAMFNLTDYFNQNISSWNVDNVETMREMFQKTSAFNQDISSWNTTNVVHMGGMFRRANSFDQDISKWNVCNVKIYGTFDVETSVDWLSSEKPNFGDSDKCSGN